MWEPMPGSWPRTGDPGFPAPGLRPCSLEIGRGGELHLRCTVERRKDRAAQRGLTVGLGHSCFSRSHGPCSKTSAAERMAGPSEKAVGPGDGGCEGVRLVGVLHICGAGKPGREAGSSRGCPQRS